MERFELSTSWPPVKHANQAAPHPEEGLSVSVQVKCGCEESLSVSVQVKCGWGECVFECAGDVWVWIDWQKYEFF